MDSLDLDPAVQQIAKQYMPDVPALEGGDFESVKAAHMEGLPLDPSQNPADQLHKDPREQVEALAAKVNPAQMVNLQQKMAKLKKKYVSLPDLNKPEEGIKRNSLKGKPLIDRIFVGGNVAVQSTDPVVLDTDIRIGYRVNKKLDVGTGLQWRESFLNRDTLAPVAKAAHGYSGFVSYDLIKGFFAYGEYAAAREQALFSETESSASWQYEYLLGVGRSFSLFQFVELNVTFPV